MAEQKERSFGLIKKIASQFVEFQDDATQQPTSQSEPSVTIPIQPITTVDNSNKCDEMDDVLFKKLGKVIEESNLPGPDYVELVNGAETIGDNADDDTRYLKAFKFIKSMYPNFSKEIVINSINEYLRILDAERANAMDELQSMWNAQVVTPESEMQKATEEIDTLRKRLQELEATTAQKTSEIAAAKADIQSKRTRFENTFNAFRGALENDKNKLTNIL